MAPKRLSATETSFLAIETPSAPAHIGTLALFEPGPGGPLTYERVKGLVAERIDRVPAFRRRIVAVPLGLDRPYAIEDEHLDLEFHVRQIGVPPPGERDDLAEIVARLHARPLDRSRPLWELYVIEGLAGGQVGLYAKVHFVAVDPNRGTEIMTALLDIDADAGSAPLPAPPAGDRGAPAAPPSQLEMLAWAGASLVRRPGRLLAVPRELAGRVGRTVRAQLPDAAEAFRETMRRTHGVGRFVREQPDGAASGRGGNDDDDLYLSRPGGRAPRVSFNMPLTPHRRVAYASLRFADVHAIKTAADTTVHAVVMAICAGALRRFLDEGGELPSEPLLAAVPVLVQGEGRGGPLADHVSIMVAALPTHVADPRRRLSKAHEAMRIAKERHSAMPAGVMADMTRYAPPAVAGLAARLVGAVSIADMASPPFNLTISNVPGPRHAVYCAGARQVASYPLSVLGQGVGLHVSPVTYDDALHVGLVADRAALPRLWDLADGMAVALEELRAAVVDGDGDRDRDGDGEEQGSEDRDAEEGVPA